MKPMPNRPAGPMTDESWAKLEAHFQNSQDSRGLQVLAFVRRWREMNLRQSEPLQNQEWNTLTEHCATSTPASPSTEPARKSPLRRGWWARGCGIFGRR
jgi:hypothetical protein